MRLKLTTIGQTLRAIPRLVAELNSRFFIGPEDFLYNEFTTALTSYGAVHTILNVKYPVARGHLIGNEFTFFLSTTFDITAGAGNILVLEIPFVLAGDHSVTPAIQQFVGCAVNDTGSPVPGTAQGIAGGNSFYIRNPTAANWAISNNKEIHLWGTVEVEL